MASTSRVLGKPHFSKLKWGKTARPSKRSSLIAGGPKHTFFKFVLIPSHNRKMPLEHVPLAVFLLQTPAAVAPLSALVAV